jgi:hypothetical protein
VEDRQRRLIAALILVVSLVIVAYLVFFAPGESNIVVPTPTTTEQSSQIYSFVR